MNTFVNAVKNQNTRTVNGMKSKVSSLNSCVDLFYKIGASRGKDITPAFSAAYSENSEVALRIASWVRDARGGAGERQIFRDILKHLEVFYPENAKLLMNKIPELGRWDDLLVVESKELKDYAFGMIKVALESGNGLCAKWMPRKGTIANELRAFLKMSPKQYRKTLVNLTNVVESQMCTKDWDNINFSHVPSIASARYKKAFNRNTPKYAEYVSKLVKGDDPTVKVNANAIFPHDVLKGRIYCRNNFDKVELDLIQKQWESLPNYVGDGNILPLVDVSGSMSCSAGNNQNLTCMDIAVSLGLYLADKNTGKFKDTFLTFSGTPELLHLKGNINDKINQMVQSKWGMNTNLNAAFNKILKVALEGEVPQEEMPKILLILSDMQFDQCVQFDDTAMQMIRRKYNEAGYDMPVIVFWNLNSYDNIPVSYNTKGAALVSGFSPAIMTSILDADVYNFTPEGIMMKTLMKDRYKVV